LNVSAKMLQFSTKLYLLPSVINLELTTVSILSN
jgi:hypothetical protein